MFDVNVLWLGQPDCHVLSMVGGKVASLSVLAADYRVPSGFCLTTLVFDRWTTDVAEPPPHHIRGALARRTSAWQRGVA